MLIALIFLTPLLSGLISYIFKKRGIRTAYIWMFLVFISLVLWPLILIIPKDNISPLIISNWFNISNRSINLRFSLTSQNWILAFSLLTYNLAFFLTGIARLNTKIDFPFWLIQIIFTAFSFLAILSADLWSLIIFWTALDLLDFISQKYILKKVLGTSYFRRLVFKIIGIMLLVWNISMISKTGTSLALADITNFVPNFSLFLSALLHSGIFPINIDSEKRSEEETGKLLNSFSKIISFTVSFSLIIYLPAPEMPLFVYIFTSLISYFFIFIAMIQWIFRKDLDDSLNYLLIGMASFFGYLYLSGASQFITFWLVILIISILWLFLFTHRGKQLLVFPIISTFFVSGLPLTINVLGPRGFNGNNSYIDVLILIGMNILFLVGYVKYAFQKNNKFMDLEVWYQTAYLSGLFLMLLSVALIIFNSFYSLENEIGSWWIGMTVLLLSATGYFFAVRKNFFDNLSQKDSRISFSVVWKFLTFDWVFETTSFIETKTSGAINSLSALLEGEGGILWALLLLLLFLTILK
jgi:hypothetical protein